ncbi:MAG: hypothetical protein M3Y69_06360 [Verrucomicrobiota bacterium]|nr:hypothetical protein [Verrucomicrobiota bacterium]
MKRDDDQELWDLLERAPGPVLSPFFARNVIRELRREPSWREVIAGWFAPRPAIAAGAALAVCVVTALTVSHQFGIGGTNDADDVPAVVAQIDPADYEIVADLDTLLAVQEDDSWDDTATL